MSDLIIRKNLFQVFLGTKFKPTGKTTHYLGNCLAPVPVLLKIIQYQNGAGGYYLFYCDETGEEFTDTFHSDINGAMEQAEFEFNVKKEDWVKVEE